MTSPPQSTSTAPLRAEGMRDLGPDDMDAFRRVERAFLEVTGAGGYREIRTPTIEPLHLFTATAALAPQLLERVYSFLDWDGWSGERVVLRPDATVPAVRWYEEHATTEVARLCYVQPVYRFESGGADRESWQCGVELFGLAAPEGDGELLSLARRFLAALELRDVTFELAHTGLVRAALEAAGLDREAQTDAYDRILEQEPGVADDLLQRYPEGSSALRLLFGVNGDARGYIANLRATLVPAVPAAAAAVAELEAAAATLEGEGVAFRVVPATAGNFEYYSGLTFRARTGATEVLAGGRYDGLGEALGGRPAPASGFAADLLRLASLTGPARAS